MVKPGETPISRARGMLRDNGLDWSDFPIRHELRKSALHLAECQMRIEKFDARILRMGELKPDAVERRKQTKAELPALTQSFNDCVARAKAMKPPEPTTGRNQCPSCGNTLRTGEHWPWHNSAGQTLKGIPHPKTDMSQFCDMSGTPAPEN